MGIKRKLFDLYAENFYDLVCQFAKERVEENFNKDKLTLVFPEVKESIQVKDNNVFRCPLCKRNFATKKPEGKIDFEEFGLTVEHVPPKCMGDLLKTMTCEDCNSYIGSFEGKVEKTFRRKYKWEEENSTTGRVSFGDREKEIGINFKLTDKGKFQLDTLEEASNEEATEELMDMISDGFDFTIHAHIPKIDKRKLLVVLYKTALLVAFYVFGYAYTESPSVQEVRTQILNPEEKIIPIKGIARLNKISEEFSYPLIGWSKRPVKALYVTFPLEVEDDRKLYTVPLPGPGSEEIFDNFISKLNSRSPGKEVDFKLRYSYEVPVGNSLELVEDMGTRSVYRFWHEIN